MTMTRKDRMLAAIRHQAVDRVPFATYNLHPFGGGHRTDPSYAGLLSLVEEKAGMLCKTGVRPKTAAADEPGGGFMEVLQEREGTQTVTTRILHTPKGDLRSIARQPDDQPGMVTEHFIKTDTDIDRYMSLPFESREFDATLLREMNESLAGRGICYVGYRDPMHSAAVLFDFNDFAVRCLTDPAPVLRLIDFMFERCKDEMAPLLKAAAGLDALFHSGGPEICTPPMMQPEMFARLVTPYQRVLVGMIQDAGFPVSLHCHGRVRQVLAQIVKCGFDVVEPLEPPDQGDIALAELIAEVGDRLCLMGYIQDQEFHYVEAGTLTKRVEAIAKLVNGRSGYIMTPTCTPFQHPASENFRRNYEEWILAADRLLSG